MIPATMTKTPKISMPTPTRWIQLLVVDSKAGRRASIVGPGVVVFLMPGRRYLSSGQNSLNALICIKGCLADVRPALRRFERSILFRHDIHFAQRRLVIVAALVGPLWQLDPLR